MAKRIKEENTINEGVMLSQAFRGIVSLAQVGDRFYVPSPEMLLIVGTPLVAYEGRGENRKPVLDKDGNETYNQGAQRILTVRLNGTKPVDVVEVFIGQLAKQDYKGRFVFPANPMVAALRSGANADAKMKETICNKVLTITENTATFTDRKWNDAESRYERDEQNRLVPGEEKVINEWAVEPLRDVDTKACKDMLMAYYEANYPDQLIDAE